MTGEQFRKHRKTKDLTQKAAGEAFGVAGNTIARWERGELPIPGWVDLLVAEQIARQEEVLQSNKRLWETSGKLARVLDANRRLDKHNEELGMEVKMLRKMVAANVRHDEILPSGKAERIFRRLARKYHPDHHPQHAEFMADLNELFQAMKKR